MKRVMFVYPRLTSYIMPVLRGMAEDVELDVFYSIGNEDAGFGNILPFEHPHITWHLVPTRHLLAPNHIGMYQQGLLSYMLKVRPDAVQIWANTRYLSYWAVLLMGRLLGIPIYSRGHGLFKRQRTSFVFRWVYKFAVGLSAKYICYTPMVKESLQKIGILERKLAVDYNTLYVEYPVCPEEKSGDEKGILFIGRLRAGCDIDVLIDAVRITREQYAHNVELHVIGAGSLIDDVLNAAGKYPWVQYHGGIYNQQQISEISHLCRMGCYPGDAGLSVVHMMALSLPVITHNDLFAHMGPEPEYIVHGKNGFFYGHKRETERLADTIRKAFELPREQTQIMQRNAYKTYHELSTPPYHQRLLNILL